VSDELLTACAKTGGLVCLTGVGIFLGENDISTDTFVRHVDYLAALIGPAHIGYGSDYIFDQSEVDDYVKAHPELFPPELGYRDGISFIPPEQLPEMAEALLRRGYSEAEVGGIFGDNLFNLAKKVWGPTA
jgi:membrane dipeptidase